MAISVDVRCALNDGLEGCECERWSDSRGLKLRYDDQCADVGRDGTE